MAATLTKVPGCMGTMIINSDGAITQSSGELENMENEAKYFFAMAMRSNMLLKQLDQKFKRLTISYQSFVYMMTCVGDTLYVVKRKPGASQDPTPINA